MNPWAEAELYRCAWMRRERPTVRRCFVWRSTPMLIETSVHQRVLRIALNRPEKRNALNSALCHDVLQAFDTATADQNIGAVLLTGNGPAFCAGMDLHET